MRYNTRKIFVYTLLILLISLVLWFTIGYREKLIRLMTPVFMGLIIAYLIHPLVLKLERKKIPRMVGVLIIYLLFALILVTSIMFLVPGIINNIKELMNSFPQITNQYTKIFAKFVSMIQSSNWPEDIKEAIFNEMQNGIELLQTKMVKYLKNILESLIKTATIILDLILAMIIAYYFIKDSDFFKETALFVIPRKWRNEFVNAGREINKVMTNFIQGQLLTAMIVGLLETIGLYFLGVKYALILGFAGGLANVIPYFGPFLGSIPAIALSLLESPMKAIWVTLLYIVIQQIDNAFISPKIIEGRLGLHPVTTILVVLIGGEFFGIIGMLLAVPITAVIKIILKRMIEALV